MWLEGMIACGWRGASAGGCKEWEAVTGDRGFGANDLRGWERVIVCGCRELLSLLWTNKSLRLKRAGACG